MSIVRVRGHSRRGRRVSAHVRIGRGLRIPKKLVRSPIRREIVGDLRKVVKEMDRRGILKGISKVEVIGSFTSRKKRPGDIDVLFYSRQHNKAGDNWNTTQFFGQNQDMFKKMSPKVDAIVINPKARGWADKMKTHRKNRTIRVTRRRI